MGTYLLCEWKLGGKKKSRVYRPATIVPSSILNAIMRVRRKRKRLLAACLPRRERPILAVWRAMTIGRSQTRTVVVGQVWEGPKRLLGTFYPYSQRCRWDFAMYRYQKTRNLKLGIFAT